MYLNIYIKVFRHYRNRLHIQIKDESYKDLLFLTIRGRVPIEILPQK